MGGSNPRRGGREGTGSAPTRREVLASTGLLGGVLGGGVLAGTAAGQEASPIGTPTPTPAGTPTPTPAATEGTALGTDWTLPRADARNTGTVGGIGPVASARRRWRTELDGEPVGPPALAGRSLYVATDDGTLTALRAGDGTERWRVEVADGELGAPAVAGDTVFVGGGGRLVALSTADGSERWRRETETDDPIPLTVADGTLYAGGTALAAHATGDGTERWRYEPEEFVQHPPAVADGTVYVATGLAVAAVDATDRGRVRWRVERREPSTPVVGDLVHVGGEDGLSALAPNDGTERWSYDPSGYVRSPTLGSDRVYASAAGGTGSLGGVATTDGTPDWERDIGTGGPAALVEGTLLLPVGSGLVAVAAADGTRRFAYEDPDEPGRSFTAPAVAGGLAFVGDDANGVQAVESPRSGARFDIDRLASGIGRAREGGLVVDDVEAELRAARDAFDDDRYDTAGRRASAGWDVLVSTRERAAAARQRIDRLAGRLEGEDGPTEAERKLATARDAYEQGDYRGANRTAVEGLELLNATRRRETTAVSRIEELAGLVEEGGFGTNAVPARFLERARTARGRGDYGNATALAERGIAAAEARITIREVRDGDVLPVVAQVSDLLGRSRELRQARAAYEEGDYRTARDHADAASDAVFFAFFISLVGIPVGLVGGGLAVYSGARAVSRGLAALFVLIATVVERVRAGVRGAVDRVTGVVSGAANAATETATAPVQARRERKRQAAEEAIAEAEETVGDPTRGGFTVPGEWTDRRVQCPECSQFAATDGGEIDPPRADCSNCDWVGDREWLVEHGHYDPEAGAGPVRPSVEALREAREHAAAGEWDDADSRATAAASLARSEAAALDAIEAAGAKVDEEVAGAPTDEARETLAAARERFVDLDYDGAAALAEEAELTAAAPVDRLVEEAREQASEAAAAVERGDYATAIEGYDAALDRYATARERAAATGDDGAVSDIGAARETARSNRAAAELARLDDELDAARADLVAAADATDAETAASAEERFEEALAGLQEVDPADHEDEHEGLLTRARQGVVEARVEQGRAEMERAEELFEDGTYSDARERFEAVADRFEATLATADEYGLDDASAEIDALVETCRTNASEARRALYDVGSVDPELSTAEDVDTGLALGLGTDAGAAATDTGAPDAGSTADTRGGGGTADGDDAATAGNGGASLSPSGDGAAGDLPDHERLEHLGTGGTAAVHRVRLADGRAAALKVPRGEDGATLSGRVVEAFVTEAETWAKLDDHPGVVEVLDWGTAPYPWLLLEYLPGGSLAERLPLAPDPAVAALTGVCEAVNHAHTRGVAHADLKPANVLFTDDDRPKVGDWGLANVLLEGAAVDEGLTPAYAAPEQLRDGSVDTATDVYQLGVVAYETLTGTNPFVGGGADDTGNPATDRTAVVDRVLAGEFDPPTAVDPSLPDRADEVVARAMATDPGDRYESVLYLRDALEGIA